MKETIDIEKDWKKSEKNHIDVNKEKEGVLCDAGTFFKVLSLGFSVSCMQ